MALQIYTNNYSVTTQNNLNIANGSLSKSIERLSSGVRINSAADDASGIAISDKLREQINGLSKASYNTQDAISLLQTAEGGLEVIGDMLHRMRELAVQAGNGIYTSSDRQQLQKELDQLKSELDRIAVSTEYNAQKLLNGSTSGIWSSNSVNIDTIIHGSPAEGNYSLEFSTEPGQNAIYKSHPFMTRFYELPDEAIVYPKGITNVKIEGNGVGSGDIRWSIHDGVIANPGDGATDVRHFVFDDVLYTGNNDLSGFQFTGAEDYRGLAGLTPFSYPYDNFSGFYLGIERVEWNGTASMVSPGGGLQYINLDNGDKAFRNGINDATASYFSFFVMDPATGVKQYPAYVTLPADKKVRAYMQGPPNVGTVAAPQSFEIQVYPDGGNTIFDKMDSGDKVLYFHQANSPADMSNNKIVDLEIKQPAGTNLTHDQNPKVSVFWDVDEHATFHAMSIVNGEFTEVKLEWDRDYDIPFENIGGEYAIRTPETFYPSGIKLKDLPTFTDVNGRSILDNTQTLTIYGNDRNTDITLEGNDSLQDLMDKLAKAIGKDLQMGARDIMPQDLVTIITGSETARSGLNGVSGTLIIQSALTGKRSELKFAGDENLLNGLGLVQLQQSSENSTTATVRDAHTGKLIGIDTVSDGVFRNIIDGVDVKFDDQGGLLARFDAESKRMVWTPESTQSAYIHIVKNASEIQVGANEGQKFDLSSISRIDGKSLGINDAYIMTMKDSQAAITKFDQALDYVSHTRATVGAQITRLRYTINNIGTGRNNMIASESRIKDLDVADESATFAKNQILVNAAVAMMAQANQLPQAALQLIGR